MHTIQEIKIAPPATVVEGASDTTVIAESCPTSLRPFVMNWLRLCFICPAFVALLTIPGAVAAADWELPLAVFLGFALIFGW